ncbi:hypothetical protein NDU88_001986 [Pleurodeles waltl]|uniref:Uncharacterized protein n=1 Tax=Pleurodeles waltl TaxID=8319 RepID=A0AAV7MMG3_PLEWA|nr:hypothetical protein NDU88_001986 [Pleurodeles waltl]
MQAITADLGLLQEDHRRLAERVSVTEKDMGELSPELAAMKERYMTLEAKVGTLKLQAEQGTKLIAL